MSRFSKKSDAAGPSVQTIGRRQRAAELPSEPADAERAERAERRLDHERLPEHLDRLYRAALVITGSREDAEDLVQDTCVRIMRRPRFLRDDNDLGYLMRAMRNTWLNTRRKRSAEARAVEETATLLDRSAPPDLTLSLEMRAVMAAVSQLPPIYRDAITAVDVLGLSCRDAAKALRTREGTIMSRVFRARVHVGRALGDGFAPRS